MDVDPSGGRAPDVLVAGEALVDFIPDGPGPVSGVETFHRRAGGAPANLAAGLARLDAPAWLLSRFGDDPFGDFLARTLSTAGVPDRFVQRDGDRPTALAFVAHDADADRSFTFYREDTADCHLDVDAVPDDALDGVSVVCVGGVMLAAEPGRSRTLRLVDRARDHGCTVVFDPNHRPELRADAGHADAVERLLGEVDVVKTTPGDVADTRFAAGDAESVARRLVDAGPHTALVTRGAAGAVAVADDRAPWGSATASHPGYDVDAVDTTGAGDAFLAGALARLVDGATLADAVRFANATAALAATGEGGTASFPDRAAVDAFLAGRA